MDFEIQPHGMMSKYPNCISIPYKVLEDLGILEGQFIQLRGNKELILEIISVYLEPADPCTSYLTFENFESIKDKNVEFRVLDVTLGCDPEFFISWEGRRISAATYLPFSGQIGSDGELGELRPVYGKHENQVTENLRELIKRIPSKLKRQPWAKGFPKNGEEFSYEAHSYHRGTPAGFHIHLGIPPEILNTRKDFSRAAMNHIVRCLDWYVSVPLIPLEVNHYRRLGRTQYGQPGDYRPTNATLEYRTPGAFYLRSPQLTRGLLGMSLMMSEIIVSRMKTASQGFLKLDKLSDSELQGIMPIPSPQKIRKTLLSTSIREAEGYIPKIKEEMEKLSNYGKHRKSIEEFFRIVESKKQPDPNLLKNWEEKL